MSYEGRAISHLISTPQARASDSLKEAALPDIDGILFDADGVFQRPPVDLGDQLARELGVPLDQADAFILYLFAAESLALTGESDILTCAEPVLERWSVRDGLETFSRLWHGIDVHWDVVEAIRALRASVTYCAVASNQQALRAHAMSVGLAYGEIFDAEFYSCHLGCKKPMEAYFREVVARCGFEPARLLFVDDRAINLDAAAAMGLRTLHFVADEHTEKGAALIQRLETFRH